MSETEAVPDDIMDEARSIVSRISYVVPDPATVSDEIAEALNAERERWHDKVDGLSSDLDSAIEVAFKRGASVAPSAAPSHRGLHRAPLHPAWMPTPAAPATDGAAAICRGH